MKFIDEAQIEVIAGDGGTGAVVIPSLPTLVVAFPAFLVVVSRAFLALTTMTPAIPAMVAGIRINGSWAGALRFSIS